MLRRAVSQRAPALLAGIPIPLRSSVFRALPPAAARRTIHISTTSPTTDFASRRTRLAFSSRDHRPYSTSSAASPEPSSAPPTPAPESSTATPSTPEKPDYLNAAETEIWDRLVREFAPAELVVQDISGGCGSMYAIEIASDRFRGVGMLKQQRMVNAVLADLMKGWHGVQLRTRAP